MKLSRFIPRDPADIWAVFVIGLMGAVIWFAATGWPSWVPWSAEQKVPVLEAENAQLTDDNLVASSQSGLDRSIAGAAQSTLTIRLEEQARTDAYVRRLEAAPDADERQRVLLEFVCGGDLYAADPTCLAGAQPPAVPD